METMGPFLENTDMETVEQNGANIASSCHMVGKMVVQIC